MEPLIEFHFLARISHGFAKSEVYVLTMTYLEGAGTVQTDLCG